MCIHLEVDGSNLVEPQEVADAFAEHFQSVYNNLRPGVFPLCSLTSWVFITRFSFWLGYFQSRYTSKTIYIQSVGILGLLNEAFLEFLCLFHIYFQHQVTSTDFYSVMKASDTYCGFYKKMQHWLLSIFNLFLHSIIAQYYLNLLGLYMATLSQLNFKLSPCQQGPTKSRSTMTNLLSYLGFITLYFALGINRRHSFRPQLWFRPGSCYLALGLSAG
jgi:hypothetical protein